MNSNNEIAKHSIALIIVENSLGSILHNFKIPLAGHFLSMNQIGILSRAIFTVQKKESPIIISLNATLLKSIGPAGKRLTPMLGILTQGILFSIPFYIIGINYISLILGILLSSLWAFLQSALLLYLFFGNNLILIIEKILKDIEKVFPHFNYNIWYLFLTLYLIKFLAAFAYSLILIKMKNEKFDLFILKHEKPNEENRPLLKKSIFSSALKELLSPLFVFSLLLTFAFLVYAESSLTTIIWGVMRPIGLGLLLFLFFKIIPIEKLIHFLKEKGFHSLTNSLEVTLSYFKNRK